MPDEDAEDDFLPTDNSEEDFGDKVPDEDTDDDFLPTDNSDVPSPVKESMCCLCPASLHQITIHNWND